MLFLDYSVLALICGLASAIVADKKGKNQYLWFFIGLAGSVFAVLIILYLNKKTSDNQTYKTKKDG